MVAPTQSTFGIATTSPEEGTTVSDRRPRLHVVFSRPLDSTTVSSETVSLWSKLGERVRGTASVGRLTPAMISFVPDRDLPAGSEYTLRVHAADIRAESGAFALSMFELNFAIKGKRPDDTPAPGGPPTPGTPKPGPGVIYAGDCNAVGNCTMGNLEVDVNGNSVPLDFNGVSHRGRSDPSPRLHGGARVWLRVSDAGGGQKLEAVISERNQVIPIFGHASTETINHPRWAKDEAFVSCRAKDSNSSTGGKMNYVKFTVTWDSTGLPSFGAPVVFLSLSGVGGYDWAPNGQDIVYRQGAEILTNVGGQVTVINSGGTWPSWSPIGNRVMFNRGSSVRVVDPDGSNPVDIPIGAVIPYPAFSPSGEDIAFIGQSASGFVLMVADLQDGSIRELTSLGTGLQGVSGWQSFSEAP
jgi:hypothetical protein